MNYNYSFREEKQPNIHLLNEISDTIIVNNFDKLKELLIKNFSIFNDGAILSLQYFFVF